MDDVNLELHAGVTAILGESGAGKTTLLNLAGGVVPPDTGEILVSHEPLAYGDDGALGLQRTWVFQDLNLISHLTALENVALPLLLAGMRRAEALARAGETLEALGLDARSHARPARLSGGEQQRVAIARALVSPARLVLADEPTGSLDAENAEKVLASLAEESRRAGKAVVLVTHDERLARRHADRMFELWKGKLYERVLRIDGEVR